MREVLDYLYICPLCTFPDLLFIQSIRVSQNPTCKPPEPSSVLPDLWSFGSPFRGGTDLWSSGTSHMYSCEASAVDDVQVAQRCAFGTLLDLTCHSRIATGKVPEGVPEKTNLNVKHHSKTVAWIDFSISFGDVFT